jgi:hypothetical protein
MGIKRLLAIRVSFSDEIVPAESVAAIQSAIFGKGSGNLMSSSLSNDTVSVVAQYAAVSHGQLQFVPATVVTGTDRTEGVLDVTLPNMAHLTGQPIVNLTTTIVAQTEQVLFGTEGRSLLDVADHVLFCLPNGSAFQDNNDTDWTAFTYLYEPVRLALRLWFLWRCSLLVLVIHSRSHYVCGLVLTLCSPFVSNIQYSYYQMSRCTSLSVVMHEVR